MTPGGGSNGSTSGLRGQEGPNPQARRPQGGHRAADGQEGPIPQARHPPHWHGAAEGQEGPSPQARRPQGRHKAAESQEGPTPQARLPQDGHPQDGHPQDGYGLQRVSRAALSWPSPLQQPSRFSWLSPSGAAPAAAPWTVSEFTTPCKQ